MKNKLALVALAAVMATPAGAADLGGNCCADLEERIAELEATTARKGNKKVSLQVYGQINAALSYVDIGEFDDTRIIQNGADESFVGFRGTAQITPGVSAGYVLELDVRQFGVGGLQENLQVNTRQSYWFLKSDTLGSISMGKTSNATNNFDKISLGNVSVATRPLSLQPVSDTYLAGFDLPLDGSFRNVVRYDSPSLAGFFVSASWGASGLTDNADTGDMWDVALRYAGEWSQIKVAGGIGYRVDDGQEIPLNIIGVNLNLPTFSETDTFLLSGAVQHVPSGLFLNGYFADQSWDGALDGLDLQAWQLQAGIETRLVSIGKTSFYGEYGEIDIDVGPDSTTPTLWGLGVVQAIDAAAMDLYMTYRAYDLDELSDDDADVFMAGARVQF